MSGPRSCDERIVTTHEEVLRMVRRSSGRRTTVYRLRGVDDLPQAIRDKYRSDDNFDQQRTSVGEMPALLVVGSMPREEAAWCAAVRELTGEEVSVAGATPAAVLLVRVLHEGGDEVFALTYGMGFQLLDQAFVDGLFGQRLALRTVDSAKLRSLTVTTMDERSRTSRATIPSGDSLRGFDLGDIGEAVSRVVGTARLEGLSRAHPDGFQIRGADAVNLPLGLTPSEVLSDLRAITAGLAAEPHEDLRLLEQLVQERNPRLRRHLDEGLENALVGGGAGRLGLAWPNERIDENGTPDSWQLRGVPDQARGAIQGQPDWETVRDAIQALPQGSRVDRLDRASIQLFSDPEGTEAISAAIPLRKWIAFELEREGSTYVLYDGRWYRVDTDYGELVRARVQTLFERSEAWALPPWPRGEDEREYNERAAAALRGVCLDRRLIRTRAHPRGIEPCDIYLPDGTLVHIKRTETSAPASHLLAQALVSALALCNDNEARTRLRERIAEAGGDPSAVSRRPRRVLLVFARPGGRPITPESLFTFTRVSLVRHADQLRGLGVEVEVTTVN